MFEFVGGKFFAKNCSPKPPSKNFNMLKYSYLRKNTMAHVDVFHLSNLMFMQTAIKSFLRKGGGVWEFA